MIGFHALMPVLVGLTALFGSVGAVMQILPSGAFAFLLAWALASIPFGIVFGHCMLSE